VLPVSENENENERHNPKFQSSYDWTIQEKYVLDHVAFNAMLGEMNYHKRVRRLWKYFRTIWIWLDDKIWL